MVDTKGEVARTAIIYTRVSGDEQAKKGYSLPDQREACVRWCEDNGYEVVEEVEDAGWSGGYLERPGLDRVRELVAEGGIGAVVVLFRDRIARGVYAQLIAQEFTEYGTRLIALNGVGNDDSPDGELSAGIMDVISGWERRKIAERTKRGRLRKAREGKIIKTAKPPYGFRYDETGERLVPFAPEMAVVERIMEMAASGMGLHRIQRQLGLEGVPSPTGKAS